MSHVYDDIMMLSPLDNDAAHGGPHEGDHVSPDGSRAAQHQPHIASNLEQLIASVQIPSIAACIKTDLLPDKPEEQLIPHRVAPHNALVQLICLELEAQIKYLDTPTKCLKIKLEDL